MELSFKEYGEGFPLIILHGLFGMGDNWATLGRKFGDHFLTFTPDLRNHGRSDHLPEMDYGSMAGDLKAFMERQWIHESFLMGHSMGGKVAMKLALEFPSLVKKLVVVDISPRAYSAGHDEIIDAMRDLNLSVATDRKSLEADLLERIHDLGVVQFILKNIIYDKRLDRYSWRMNLDTIHLHYEKILEALDPSSKYEGPTLFIGGSKSRYIKETDHELIYNMFPAARIEMIEGAGHWVHAEKPIELFELVTQFLLED